jgi:hypothetical protein
MITNAVYELTIATLIILTTALIIYLDAQWSTLVTQGHDGVDKNWLVSRARYHGTLTAEQMDGEWCFYRNGKRCRLW